MSENVKDLFAGAEDRGAIGGGSLQGLIDLGQQIQGAMGVSAEDVEASEVLLLTLEVDDSSSIRFVPGNSQAVRDGHNLVLDATEGSASKDDVLAYTHFLNGGVVSPFSPLASAMRLDQQNYNPAGHTPLYDETMVVLGAVIAKEQEFADQGVPIRAITVIVTDGQDVGSVNYGTRDVKKLVADMLRSESHIVAFVGIDDGQTDFRQIAHEMGIQDDWVLTPKNTPSEIRKAFGVISRASKSASQGAAAFSQTKAGGFDAGIS